MKKEVITIYQCDFCDTKSENEDWMRLHEEICPLNPKNQPCATCKNQILVYGCAKNMNMEIIGGNIKCFFYKEGLPSNPFDIIMLDGNIDPENI